MNRSMIAGAALVAGIAIAAPMFAWSADSPTQRPAAPAQPGMPGMGGMRDHDGAIGHHGWMREMMMHRMMRLEPRQRCEERLARRAGMVAYTVAKLNLTAEQRPSWDKLQGLMQTASDKQRQLCAVAEAGCRARPGDDPRPGQPARAVPHRPAARAAAGPPGAGAVLSVADPRAEGDRQPSVPARLSGGIRRRAEKP